MVDFGFCLGCSLVLWAVAAAKNEHKILMGSTNVRPCDNFLDMFRLVKKFKI